MKVQTVNKSDLVNHIAKESKFTNSPMTRAQVRQVIDALFEVMAAELTVEGGRVEIEHFGVWECRTTQNKNHGELSGTDGVKRKPPMNYFLIKFRAAKKLRKKLNK